MPPKNEKRNFKIRIVATVILSPIVIWAVGYLPDHWDQVVLALAFSGIAAAWLPWETLGHPHTNTELFVDTAATPLSANNLIITDCRAYQCSNPTVIFTPAPRDTLEKIEARVGDADTAGSIVWTAGSGRGLMLVFSDSDVWSFSIKDTPTALFSTLITEFRVSEGIPERLLEFFQSLLLDEAITANEIQDAARNIVMAYAFNIDLYPPIKRFCELAKFMAPGERKLPSYTELEQLREDAERWRAITTVGRMRTVGSAGFGDRPNPEQEYHITIDFWNKHTGRTTEVCRTQFTRFADIAREQLANPPSPGPEPTAGYKWRGEGPPPASWYAEDGTLVHRSTEDYRNG